MTAAENAGTGTAHYAVSTDGRTTWSVAKGTDGVSRLWNAAGQYNNDAGTTQTHDLDNASNHQTFNLTQLQVNLLASTFLIMVINLLLSINTNDKFKFHVCTPYDITTASYNSKDYFWKYNLR